MVGRRGEADPHSPVYRHCVLQGWRAVEKEPDWTVQGGVPELKKQLDLNDSLPNVNGTILFREDYLNQPQTQQAVNYLRGRWGS